MKVTPDQLPLKGTVHILEMEKLRLGDVLLTRAPGEIASDLIRTVTGFEYSHAILVLNPPLAAESAQFGVVKFMLGRLALLDPRNLLVLRPREGLVSQRDLKTAIDFIEAKATTRYANIEVLFSMSQSLPKMQEGAFFCSQLVAEAYLAAGVEIVPGRRPERTTPRQIAESTELVVVPGCTSQRKIEELAFAPAYLDGYSPTSLAEQESLIAQSIINEIADDFEKAGVVVYTLSDAIEAISSRWLTDQNSSRELDQILALAMASHSFAGFLHRNTAPESDTYFYPYYLHRDLLCGSISLDRKEALRTHFEQMTKVYDAQVKSEYEQLQALRISYLETGLESIRLMLARTLHRYQLAQFHKVAADNCTAMLTNEKFLGSR